MEMTDHRLYASERRSSCSVPLLPIATTDNSCCHVLEQGPDSMTLDLS